MTPDDDYLAETRFFEMVATGDLPPSKSLEEITGLKGGEPPYVTDLVRRAEEAWRTPLEMLTCEQVRLFVGQKMGLEWLGKPAIEFARRYPEAVITNYPGEMVLLCLRAADELAEIARPDLAEWLAHDFGWMDRVFDWDDEEDLVAQAKVALTAARRLIRLQ